MTAKPIENRPAARITWRDALLIAVFFGLAAGVIDVGIALFRGLILGRFMWLSRDLVWMTPLAAVLFLLIPGILLAVLAAWRRSLPIAWIVGPLVFYATFALFLNTPRIAHYAMALVAAGVAVRLAAHARHSPNAWLRVARRGALALAAMVVVIGAAERSWRWATERTALARLGAAAPDAPNVLLVILDTVRRSNMSLYGYARPTTPNLNARASEGAVFDFALSTAPWTLPSHATVFTGVYPDSTTGDWNRSFDTRHRTLAEAFRDRGYVTGGFVDNLLYTSYESGLNDGFVHYADYPITFPLVLRHFVLGRTAFVNMFLMSRSLGDVARALGNFNFQRAREAADEPPDAARRSKQFLEWEAERGKRPFFAFINFFEAHGLFKPTPGEDSLFPGGKRSDYYDAAISRLDRVLEGILDSLQQRGVLDNTIVVVTSDHGEHLGEHGLEGHANSLYLDVLRVPLYIRYPRAVPAQRITEPVTLRDLAATILDLAGAREGSGIPGSTLAYLWGKSPRPPASPLFATLTQGINVPPSSRNANGPLASLLDSRFHLIRGPGESEELFAYRTDTLEETNLIASGSLADETQHLRETLLELIGAAHTGTNGSKEPNAR
ncbi:MAG TPA: sulfatase-like hydrolase/transferase [Gemmatimonadaceae bacterium]|nr:sulfatase-like hydrolase/transferase [Gemmatimonadaceae bacterium]